MTKLVDKFLLWIMKLGAYVFFPLLVFVSMYDIIGRQFANVGSTQLQELQWYSFFVFIMFAIAYAYLNDSHVRVDIFHGRFSDRTRAIIELVGILFAATPLAILLIITGSDMTWSAFVSGERSPASMGLPYRWVMKAMVPFCGFLLLLCNYSKANKAITVIKTGSNRAASDEVAT
jgi:TRAP-type mannitol/chloroaromatic compound transport system permease small subunit